MTVVTEVIREVHWRLTQLLLKLLKNGRRCFGPDGRPVVDDKGEQLYRECGPADLAVVVSYLRLMNVRAVEGAPKEQLAALIERAQQRGWKPEAGADEPEEEDDNETS